MHQQRHVYAVDLYTFFFFLIYDTVAFRPEMVVFSSFFY